MQAGLLRTVEQGGCSVVLLQRWEGVPYPCFCMAAPFKALLPCRGGWLLAAARGGRAAPWASASTTACRRAEQEMSALLLPQSACPFPKRGEGEEGGGCVKNKSIPRAAGDSLKGLVSARLSR